MNQSPRQYASKINQHSTTIRLSLKQRIINQSMKQPINQSISFVPKSPSPRQCKFSTPIPLFTDWLRKRNKRKKPRREIRRQKKEEGIEGPILTRFKLHPRFGGQTTSNQSCPILAEVKGQGQPFSGHFEDNENDENVTINKMTTMYYIIGQTGKKKTARVAAGLFPMQAVDLRKQGSQVGWSNVTATKTLGATLSRYTSIIERFDYILMYKFSLYLGTKWCFRS